MKETKLTKEQTMERHERKAECTIVEEMKNIVTALVVALCLYGIFTIVLTVLTPYLK